MTKYYLKSEKIGLYLTDLFTDYLSKAFTAKEPNRDCYYYNTKEIAESVAEKLGNELIPASKILVVAID